MFSRRRPSMNESPITLAQNALTMIPRGAKGARLTCLSGKVWITCRDCPADLVLTPGREISLEGHRDICIQALEDTVFLLHARRPAAALPLQRAALA
jgi:hypothetical protein